VGQTGRTLGPPPRRTTEAFGARRHGPRSFVVGDRDARVARAYRDALWRYVNLDDESGLADLEGRSIQGYRLETDPGELDVMIGSGELDVADIGSGDIER
jgi:hypothetical protein